MPAGGPGMHLAEIRGGRGGLGTGCQLPAPPTLSTAWSSPPVPTALGQHQWAVSICWLALQMPTQLGLGAGHPVQGSNYLKHHPLPLRCRAAGSWDREPGSGIRPSAPTDTGTCSCPAAPFVSPAAREAPWLPAVPTGGVGSLPPALRVPSFLGERATWHAWGSHVRQGLLGSGFPAPRPPLAWAP